REPVRVDLRAAGVLPQLAAEVLGHPLDVRHPSHVQPAHVVVDRFLEVTANFDGQIPLRDELVFEDADAAFAGQETLPRAFNVRRDRSRRRDGGYHNIGVTAVSSGRFGHLLSASCFEGSASNLARSAWAASGFSSS